VDDVSRAAVLTAPGHPLDLQSYPRPEPEPGAAVVRVEHGGICGTDLHIANGHLPVPGPVVLGHEAVGRVETLGAGVTTDALGTPLAVGDAVTWVNSITCGTCFYCRVEHESTLCTGERKVYGINRRADEWPHLSGGWADHIYLQPGTTIVRLPDSVSPLQAIALGCAGPTAVHGLLDQAPVRPGDTVVVLGAGPVGIASALYARIGGAERIVLIGGPASRLDAAKRLGIADEYLDIADGTHAERVAAIRRTSRSGHGADLVVECAGVPAAVAEAMDHVRPNGTLCVLGQYTDHGPTPMNPYLITGRQLRLIGSRGFGERHFIDYVRTLPQLLALADVTALVTQYPLDDVRRAMADVAAGTVVKAVLST
jgi:threonine dehydrogenase-like Zn-dependent dehydrogenase